MFAESDVPLREPLLKTDENLRPSGWPRISRFALAAILVGSSVARAANADGSVRWVDGKTGGTKVEVAHIEISGRITSEMPAQLRDIIPIARERTNLRTLGGDPKIVVYLRSPGGSGRAGLAMGRMLRAVGAETWVRPGDRCESACVFVFAGGVERLLFDRARLGVHRPTLDREEFARLDQEEATRRYRRVEEDVRQFLSEMGVADQLFVRMMQVPSGRMLYLSEDEATALNLIGVDSAYAEWDRARSEQQYAPEFLDGLDKYVECLNAGENERKCLTHIPRPPSRGR